MTSPVGGLFRGMLNQLGAGSEFGPVVTTEQRRRLARGLFDSYCADQAATKDVIFDTNRMWSAQMPALMDLFPGAKLIACVRNVAWVMDSIERRYRANPFEITRLFSDDTERNTVYNRVDTLAQRNRMVGYPWTALKEAFYGEHAASLLVVDTTCWRKSRRRCCHLSTSFWASPSLTKRWGCTACTRCAPKWACSGARPYCRPTCSSSTASCRDGKTVPKVGPMSSPPQAIKKHSC